MELKNNLQEKLFTKMISEPRLESILNLSPYKDIRKEAYNFFEAHGAVEPVSSMRHTFQRKIWEGTLCHFIRDFEQNGTQSFFYREFYAHFTDQEFRRLRDP